MKRIEVKESSDTLELLKKAKRTAKRSERNKIQVIILVLKGKRISQIATYLGLSKPTIYAYIKKYNSGGLKELLSTRHNECGRKPKLSQTQQDELKTVIKQSPQEIGFGNSTNWNTFSIAEYIKQTYGIEITRSGVREMLVRNHMSYTRPTYVLAKADTEKQEAFLESLEEIKKI